MTQLLSPISRPGASPDFEAALPEPSAELAGAQRAVGTPLSALVYRCNFDTRLGRGNWSFVGYADARWLSRLCAPSRRPKVYVASRASHPELPALWRQLRAEGADIVSTWIDVQGEEGRDLAQLWTDIEEQVRACDRLVLYVRAQDFPLKGAFIEVGLAMGMGKPVLVVLQDVEVDPASLRPVGSWLRHPGVAQVHDLRSAVMDWSVSSANAVVQLS